MRGKVSATSWMMDLQCAGVCFHRYSVPPPPPLEAEKAPETEKCGIGQEPKCLVSSYGGSRKGIRRSESEVREVEGAAMEGSAAASVEAMQEPTTSEAAAEEEEEEEGGRERLKRHRREMAGRVWIPEIWGQEELLKDWIDCSAFDACLFPTGIGSARAALVEEGRRANSGGIRLENRC